ncbi:MAG: class I SAM-dependent methyltransferase [Blastocatellia bacterium]
MSLMSVSEQVVSQQQITPVQFESVKHCPVCESRNHQDLFVACDRLCKLPGEFKVARCNQCGLVYLKERPDARSIGFYYPQDSYYAYKPPVAYSLFLRDDSLAAIWYTIKKSILAFDYNYRHFDGNKLYSQLARLPLIRNQATFELDALMHPYVKDGSLLEVGCGSGMYLDLMRALGWKRVVGIDISSRAIEQAASELKLEAYCGELKDVCLDDESFDAVSLSHTLEHVSDPVGFLREAYRLMKRGARLAIVVPNIESLTARVFGQNWFHLDAPRHLVNFTRSSLRVALERAGFQVESLKTNPRMGYKTSLFSYSRKAGDDNSSYADGTHRYPFTRRAQSLLLSVRERIECAAGLPAGDEMMAVARKPR